ncbi:hypothetical protein [Enterococcus sp. DIV0756]|uniref:hypothetical protein n=1 Tax=Enterococcus sp. DIV0756 TaxID=2774636 RepID=UPI003F26B4FC
MEVLAKVSLAFWRFHFYPAVFIAILLTMLFPTFFGVENASFLQSAEIYERFFPLIGLIVFIPLYLPDSSEETTLLIKTKRFSYVGILLLRFLQILITLLLLTCGCLLLFELSNATIEFDLFLFSGIANALFMGGLYAIGFAFANQSVTGLILPLGYYVASLFVGEKYLQIFYLFTLGEKDTHSKLVLFFSGLLFILLSFVIRKRRK